MPTLYKANGEKKTIERKRAFSTGELQKYVGGDDFELIPLGNHYLVVNEIGRIIGLPINENATRIAMQFGFYAIIVGDALFTEKRFVK